MEDLYKPILMMKWASTVVTNKASKMRKRSLIKQLPENNSMIIKKHNHRAFNNVVIKIRAKNGFYKNPEFN
jgi:hypothetical protein